jgi:hypothetical protein
VTGWFCSVSNTACSIGCTTRLRAVDQLLANAQTGHVELLSFWSCSNSHALAGFLIVDDVLSWPQFAKSSYKRCCIVEGLRCLDEMQTRVTLHLVDAKGHRTLNSGLQGTGERAGVIITYTDVK